MSLFERITLMNRHLLLYIWCRQYPGLRRYAHGRHEFARPALSPRAAAPDSESLIFPSASYECVLIAVRCGTSVSASCRDPVVLPSNVVCRPLKLLVFRFRAQAGETSFVWVLQIMVPGPPHYAFVCYFTPGSDK